MLESFADLSSPLVADACIRCGVPLRAPPPGIAAVVAGGQIAGRALPARHYGSVDVFLEALGRAGPGDVLVVDNGGGGGGSGGRGCVGAAPRYAGTGGDRPSSVQLRQLPSRAGAPG